MHAQVSTPAPRLHRVLGPRTPSRAALLRLAVGAVPAMAITLCTYFAAQTANHLVEDEALVDSSDLARAPEPPTPSASPRLPRDKSGTELAARNMFCSACVPSPPEDDPVDTPQEGPPRTDLPLRLVATQVSTVPAGSSATVENTKSDRKGAYSLDQNIPDAGKIVHIGSSYIDFENHERGRIERLFLLEVVTPIAKAGRAIVASASGEFDDAIHALSDTEYELDRDEVDRALENPASFAKGVRVGLASKAGKPDGFRLQMVRPDSVFAKLGLKAGDTLHGVNDIELKTMEDAMQAYSQLRRADKLAVRATRGGKEVTLQYHLR